MAQTTLVIRHLEDTDPPRFEVERLSADPKRTKPTTVPSPAGFPVEGRPDSDLLQELRWYLEDFLTYPFPPETEHAERVLATLRKWGEEAFDALFEGRKAGHWFEAATGDNYSDLTLRIQSDDPRILAWPWEALRDPEAGAPLAHTCRVERRLNNVPAPRTLPASLPQDRVNILLVIARPYGDEDVRFRSIARPLIDLIEERKLPARVHLLRPPTFKQLDDHLKSHPGQYHILHFDGHGSYGNTGDGGADADGHGHGKHHFQGPEGQLIFETEEGKDDPVSAEKLNILLSEHAVPGVVLNACQSAMISADAKDPFASVAASLLRAGTRSVTAMAYTLYVSGAQKFLPPFYEDLFDKGDFAEAVRAGRRAMLLDDKRVCARGEFPLQDWLLPVTYQQQPIDFSFAKQAEPKPKPRESKLPKEIGEELRRRGFVGRDQAVLDLERAMRRPPAGILIEGMGGVGKTTLARGFLDWLDKTSGLGQGCYWFGFQEIRTADYVLNRLGEAFFGGQFAAASMEERIDALAKFLRENRFLIVWDNFESASGIEETSVTANLSQQDRDWLRRFLEKLRGGASKVIITSRSPENWLSHQDCYRLRLRGLDGEERWEYCQAVLRDLRLSVNREDSGQVKLMNFLRGHPLAMRMVLPKLAEMPAGRVLKALRSNVSSLELDAIGATVRFIEEGLPEELRPLLVPLGMHEGFVDADYLEAMAKQVGEEWTRERIDRLFSALRIGGLLWEAGQGVWVMHPVLSGYLRSNDQSRASEDAGPRAGVGGSVDWERAFVDIMGSLADAYTPKELHEQRVVFHMHGANFHNALSQAERLGMETGAAALTQALAAYALNTRDFAGAARLFERQAEHGKATGDQKREAAAYHQLGIIAQEQRDFGAAEQWYQKSLAINEKLGNEHGAASTYHQLGIIAQEQREFAAAERWYQKSLAIEEKQGNEHGAAITYHQLGRIAQEQRDFAAAERWCQKSLAIEEKQGDEYGAAITYYQLGRIAQEQRDFAAAEQWYQKSLAIEEKQGNEHGAAITYHQLGVIAQQQRDFGAAEQWYQKSLAIKEKQGNEHGAATTYHQLGMIAQQQRDFGAAEQWYQKSLAIKEKQGNEHGAASTYGQLGIVAGLQERFEDSGRWLVKCIKTFLSVNDPHGAKRNESNFLVFYRNAPPAEQAKLRALWQEAGLGDFPEQAEGAVNT